MGQTSYRAFFASVGPADNSLAIAEYKVVDIALTVGIILVIDRSGMYKLVAGTNLELPLQLGNKVLNTLQPSFFPLLQHLLPLPFSLYIRNKFFCPVRNNDNTLDPTSFHKIFNSFPCNDQI